MHVDAIAIALGDDAPLVGHDEGCGHGLGLEGDLDGALDLLRVQLLGQRLVGEHVA